MSRTSVLCLVLALAPAGCSSQPDAAAKSDNRAEQEAKGPAGGALQATISFAPEKSGDHWQLSGMVSEELESGDSLWVVAEQDGTFRVVHPSIETSGTSWRHRTISLPSGEWKLHVCLVDGPGASKRSTSGAALDKMPPGFQSLASTTLVVAAAQQPAGNPAARPIEPPTQQLAAEPPGDKVVVLFNAPVEDIRARVPFGIFREEIPLREKATNRKWQWIEELDGEVMLADGTQANALRLKYDVSNRATYNGWWIDLDEADWSPYSNGLLVLRLRQGDPGTSVFKIELKNDPDNPRKNLPFIVRLNQRHFDEMKAQGFCDVSIPMEEITAGEDLSSMLEFVIVLENSRVDAKTGELLIRSVRLSPDSPAIEN